MNFVSPCPEHFDVRQFCIDDGGCTLDGKPVDDLWTMKFDPGSTLTIPADALFAAAPGDVRDLLFVPYGYADYSLGYFGADIDGASATAVVPNPERTDALGTLSFRWDPFPASPQALHSEYTASATAHTYSGINLWLEDGACEDEHPRPQCAV